MNAILNQIQHLEQILSDISQHIETDNETYARFSLSGVWEDVRIDFVDGKYIAQDEVDTKHCATFAEAMAWIIDSIDQALSTEAGNLRLRNKYQSSHDSDND